MQAPGCIKHPMRAGLSRRAGSTDSRSEGMQAACDSKVNGAIKSKAAASETRCAALRYFSSALSTHVYWPRVGRRASKFA